jgi:hypothetical protein
VLQLTVLQPAVTNEPVEGASLKTLIKDPYILIAAGSIGIASLDGYGDLMFVQVPFRLGTLELPCLSRPFRFG